MSETAPARPELTGWKKLAVDLGPLLLFFIAYNRYDMFVATAVFMVAIAAAVLASWLLVRHVPAVLWFSAVLVGVFGGLTLWLQDETFIKVKPTIVFAIFSAILFFGQWTGRNYIRALLGSAFTGLSDHGWHLLQLRWAFFFLAMAIANELIWRFLPTDIWVHFKVWGDTLLTFAFALVQLPMLKREGLVVEEKKADQRS
jgi:intracellular septation protein